MRDIDREVQGEIDRLADEMVELCRALVRINTINPYAGGPHPGSEKRGQEYLRTVMDGLGARTRLFEPPADIFERMNVLGPKGRSWKDRPNLVSEFDLGAGPRIIINSHIDTVGVEGMEFDPFSAEIKDGRILGRGASDDKGGLAMGVIAIKAALKFADELRGSIVHESVVDEECNGSGAGTLACCLEGCAADEAVVIDGGELEVSRGCAGVLTADVTVHGKGGHAATGGVNAIDKAFIVKQAIDRFAAGRRRRFPACLTNIGILQAGIHPAVVPSTAYMSLNMSYALAEARENQQAGRGWGGAGIREAFVEMIREADRSDDWLRKHPSRVEWVKDLVPFETPAESPVVREFSAAWEAVMGRPACSRVIPAWADVANLAHYGGVPSVMFGPGTRDAAHSQNESVRIADLVAGAKVVAVYLCRRLARAGSPR